MDVLPTHETKRYKTRPLTDIKALTVHHTYGWSGPPDIAAIEAIARFHIYNEDRQWPGIGYHFVISPVGKIYQTNYEDTISYHSGGNNEWSVGIALAGNFMTVPPNVAQQDAARALVAYLKETLDVTEVLPHRGMPGAATACPGDTYEDWFDYVAGG